MAVRVCSRLLLSAAAIAGCIVGRSDVYGKGRQNLEDLYTAAVTNDIAAVKKLIAQGVPATPSSGDPAELAPLVAAVQSENLAIAQLLIENGAEVNFPSNLTASTTGTALHQAAMRGNIPIVKLLLSAGADVNRQGDQWGTPLLEAIKSHLGDVPATVRLLIESGADVNKKKRESLGHVYQRSPGDLTRHKIETGGCEASPLHVAVFALDIPIIRLLIDRGADPMATDVNGLTPRQCAQKRLEIAFGRDFKHQIQEVIDVLGEYHRASE